MRLLSSDTSHSSHYKKIQQSSIICSGYVEVIVCILIGLQFVNIFIESHFIFGMACLANVDMVLGGKLFARSHLANVGTMLGGGLIARSRIANVGTVLGGELLA